MSRRVSGGGSFRNSSLLIEFMHKSVRRQIKKKEGTKISKEIVNKRRKGSQFSMKSFSHRTFWQENPTPPRQPLQGQQEQLERQQSAARRLWIIHDVTSVNLSYWNTCTHEALLPRIPPFWSWEDEQSILWLTGELSVECGNDEFINCKVTVFCGRWSQETLMYRRSAGGCIMDGFESGA